MFKKLYNIVSSIGNVLMSPFLLVIRLYWGYQFAITGFGKLNNLAGIASYFQSLGIPLPYLNAALAGTTEMVGGTLLFLGLYSRLAAIPLFCVMVTAYLTAESASVIALFTSFDPTLFFSSTPFLFAYAVVIVFCFGPGKISFDYLLSGAYKSKEMP